MQTQQPTYRIVVNKFRDVAEYYPMVSFDNTIWKRILTGSSECVGTMDEAKEVIEMQEKQAPKVTIFEKKGDKYIELTDKEI